MCNLNDKSPSLSCTLIGSLTLAGSDSPAAFTAMTLKRYKAPSSRLITLNFVSWQESGVWFTWWPQKHKHSTSHVTQSIRRCNIRLIRRKLEVLSSFLTLCHSSSPAFWNSSRYPKIFPLPVSVGGSQDRVTDSLVKSMA